jgi:hypothetical protein
MTCLPRASVLLALCVGAVLPRALQAQAPAPARIAVLDIELNNLTKDPDDPADRLRLTRLTETLRRTLSEVCGYQLSPVDSAAAQASRLAEGYLYAHPDVAAALAVPGGAEWVVIPRLNRVSPWITDLQAHVARVPTGEIVTNRVVELKGFGMNADLTARLTERGAAWMADQIDQAIVWNLSEGTPDGRHCSSAVRSPE